MLINIVFFSFNLNINLNILDHDDYELLNYKHEAAFEIPFDISMYPLTSFKYLEIQMSVFKIHNAQEMGKHLRIGP